jgi:two-component system, LytTR family, sensor kinase
MKRIVEPTIHVVIWLTGFFLIAAGVKTIGVFHKSEGSILFPLISGTLINIALFYTTALVFIPKLSANRKAIRFIGMIAGLVVGLTLVESLLDYAFFTSLFSSVKENFRSQLLINFALNVIVLSIALAYGFTKNWVRNERMKQLLKEERLTAELNFLKAQINPHFLFNVLNMAFSSATKTGDEKTANIIEKLSGLMRYMLYESNSDKVKITKEIEYIEDYIELQKMRFSSEIPVTVKFQTSGLIEQTNIAPLILIPFIENAFKYGIKFNQPSTISIDLKISENRLLFRVLNSRFSGHDQVSKPDSGIGLENVKRRLTLIYPDRHHLTILEQDKHFSIELNINLNHSDHEMHGS